MLVIVFIQSFLMNFVWEMWQMPFFTFSEDGSYTAMNWMCTQASLGDGLISVLAFLIVRYRYHSFHWYRFMTKGHLVLYLAVGLVLTVVLEWINIYVLGRWDYSPLMPLIPVLRVGLVPVLQWLVVPILLIVSLRRGEQFLKHY